MKLANDCETKKGQPIRGITKRDDLLSLKMPKRVAGRTPEVQKERDGWI